MDIMLNDNDFNVVKKWDIIQMPESYISRGKMLEYIVVHTRKHGNYKLLPKKNFRYRWMYYLLELYLWLRDTIRLQRTRINNIYNAIIEYYRGMEERNARYMAERMKRYINKNNP